MSWAVKFERTIDEVKMWKANIMECNHNNNDKDYHTKRLFN